MPVAAGGKGAKVNKAFKRLVAGYLLLFLVMAVFGWRNPVISDARAPEFSGIAAESAAIMGRNLGALALLVIGNAVTVGVFGAVAVGANAYWAGSLMRAASADAPPWLWSFVPVEVFAFVVACAASAPAVFIGADSAGRVARAVGFAAGLLCLSAVFEAVLIQRAWRL